MWHRWESSRYRLTYRYQNLTRPFPCRFWVAGSGGGGCDSGTSIARMRVQNGFADRSGVEVRIH